MRVVLHYFSIQLIGLILIALVGCDGYNGDYFPYAMKGLNVLVYDNEQGKEFFAGFVEASYSAKTESLSQCAIVAGAYAKQYHFKNWGYVCCTVTSSSGCMTKVR